MKRYTFLATYHNFDDAEYTLRLAENLALEEWRAALDHKKMIPIQSAKLRFHAYNFRDYPYKELLKNYISTHYRNSWGDLCSFGEYFDDEEALIAKLDQEKMLMELTVEVDE